MKLIPKGFKINKLVRHFIMSDLMLFGGWGLIAPIFAVFVIEDVAGATLATVGISAAIYWLVRSIAQIPIAVFLDKTDGEKDDFYALVLGLFLAAISAFLFLVVKTIPQLYLVQTFHAIAFALYTPSWSAIFSRHIDRSSIALSWSLDRTALGIATGITGLLGGLIANAFGFAWIFVGAGILSLVSVLIIWLVPDLILPPAKKDKVFLANHSPRTIQH